MLAPVTPVWAVRDLFLAMGLGAWLCVGYTLLRVVLGGARWAVFTCDALAAFGALLAWRAAAVSIFYAGVPRWYTLCGMAAAFLALRALLAAPARRLRALLLRLARHAGGPLARLPVPSRDDLLLGLLLLLLAGEEDNRLLMLALGYVLLPF